MWANGEYLGGAIAPGIEISWTPSSVGRRPSARVELGPPETCSASPRSRHPVRRRLRFSGQVDGLCTRIQAELGPCTVVSTGGLADLITPLSSQIQHTEPWLTLHGLRLVYEKNA